MPEPAHPSLSTRFATWYRIHRTAATAAVLAGAVVLLGIAGGIAWSLTRQASQIAADPSASASASQLPSEHPSASPDTTSPSAAPATPSEAPSATPQPWTGLADFPPLPPSWGVVVVDGLNVRSGPEDDDPVIGVLDDGALVKVLEAGGRLQVLGEGIAGWVSVGDPADAPWVRALPTPFSWTRVNGIASDGSGYLAYGTWAELEFPPYEGGFDQPLLLRSDDGVSWTEVHPDALPGQVTDAAGGPGGWVAISHHYYGGIVAAHSSDGSTWSQTAGLLGTQHAVAHGPAGWVIVSYDYEAGLSARRSDDGRTWTEPVPLPGDGSQPELEAGSAGYVAFDRLAPSGLASTDGVTWRAFQPPGTTTAWIADVELVDGELLAVTVSQADGASTIHRGNLAPDGTVTWTGTVDPSAFAGARVDSIASGDDGLLALGWDADDLVPVTWTSSDGASWSRHDPGADAFGGLVGPEPAWAAGGWVALGADRQGPTLWRSSDGASWSLAGRPEPMAQDAPRCPSADAVTTLDLIFLGDRGLDCFGGATLTVRGWVPLIEGLGGCCWPDPEPDWLAGPYPAAWLTSGEVDHWGLNLYVAPGVDPAALATHTWVEVRGHFDDPAAATCRRSPLPDFLHRVESQALVRDECARRFVVESITPASAP